jgi:hypothetical protein
MKKAKSGEKSKKNDKDQEKNKKVILVGPKPNEEEIRKKASELYHQRIETGEHGTAEEDWIEAEKYLNDLYD